MRPACGIHIEGRPRSPWARADRLRPLLWSRHQAIGGTSKVPGRGEPVARAAKAIGAASNAGCGCEPRRGRTNDRCRATATAARSNRCTSIARDAFRCRRVGRAWPAWRSRADCGGTRRAKRRKGAMNRDDAARAGGHARCPPQGQEPAHDSPRTRRSPRRRGHLWRDRTRTPHLPALLAVTIDGYAFPIASSILGGTLLVAISRALRRPRYIDRFAR